MPERESPAPGILLIAAAVVVTVVVIAMVMDDRQEDGDGLPPPAGDPFLQLLGEANLIVESRQ